MLHRCTTSVLRRTGFQRNSSSVNIIQDYSPFISAVSARRQPSAIRAIQPLTKLPGMISLGGGYPNGKTFPFEELSFTMRGGKKLHLQGADLANALQYSGTVSDTVFMSRWSYCYRRVIQLCLIFLRH